MAVRFDGLHEAWASADYDLLIEIRHRARYEIVLTGRPTVFTLHYLQHVARHLRNVLAGFDALDAPLDTVSLLDDEERARLRAHAEPVAVHGTFLEQFAQRAASAPDSIAVATAEASLTYAELDEQSSRLASFRLAEYAIERTGKSHQAELPAKRTRHRNRRPQWRGTPVPSAADRVGSRHPRDSQPLRASRGNGLPRIGAPRRDP
ncbi:hypothetical protein WM34_10995 [Burkholderia ubonensis]|uniref:hypothetical protein n=2 Tax=Burkholderia ubonensis TaxID=101571 RepID=UPI000755C039|nr:hypothetical protein [Burkholderia ubonensis]KWC98542.1 hypothetical protein WL59_19920 [Burkholderia ubonensis]KWD16660.1 hypothetical protein WL60_00755 [Burkholderia ubonensis]KWO96320.1 hypothetical protein WM34_10995 [Burkholderia ubonensis]